MIFLILLGFQPNTKSDANALIDVKNKFVKIEKVNVL